MQRSDELLLEALKMAMKNQIVDWKDGVTKEDWLTIFQKAEEHKILPMIFEAVYLCPAAEVIKDNLMTVYRNHVFKQVMLQVRKTNEFLALNQYLQKKGIRPLVVKGIICRNMYPKSEHRISGDEDMLVNPEQFELCHEAMLEYGMQVLGPNQGIHKVHEVTYGRQGSPLRIELHKSLFPPESEAYGELNAYFSDVFEKKTVEHINNTAVYTMNYTEHLFYLICHAFKHFLHSGFGIRQVCDIVMMANAHGSEIDWIWILNKSREIRADVFAAALFQIGEKYLVFDSERACYPDAWKAIQTDASLLLEDLLLGGVYGGAQRKRLHSSTITLNAVVSHKKGKKVKGAVLKSLFPAAKNLQGRYAYLEKYPILLPMAWMNRIFKYREELKRIGSDSLSDSLKIGEERVKILKKYGIID